MQNPAEKTHLRHQEIRSNGREQRQLLAHGLGTIRAQHQRTHLLAVPDRHVGHGLDAARDDDVIGAGGNETDAGGDGLVGADARHGDGVRRCLQREASAQRRLAGNVRGLHLLDDGAIDDVVDELLVDARLAQQAPTW